MLTKLEEHRNEKNKTKQNKVRMVLNSRFKKCVLGEQGQWHITPTSRVASFLFLLMLESNLPSSWGRLLVKIGVSSLSSVQAYADLGPVVLQSSIHCM